MGDRKDNEKRLRDARVLRPGEGEIPPAFKAVVDGLTPDEVDVIIAVNKRLEEAARVEGIKAEPGGLPGYVHFMMPP